MTLSRADLADLQETTKVKVSVTDTTGNYLQSKLVQGSNITITKNNDGYNESLTIAANGSSIFTPGGDLSGSSTSQTVTRIQGYNVSSITPTDGYIY